MGSLVLFSIFSREFVSLGWHLFYGNSLHYLGWEIPVPWGWLGYAKPEAQALMTFPRLYNPNKISGMFFGDSPAQTQMRYDKHYERWKSLLIPRKTAEGYHFVGERKVRAADIDSYCLEFAENINASKLSIECVIPGERVGASYLGLEEEKSKFYFVLEHVKRVEPLTEPSPPTNCPGAPGCTV